MKTVLHLSLIKRIAFIALVFFIYSSCRKEIDQAAKNTVDQAPKDTVEVTVLTAQQGCDTLNRATITIQLIPVAAIPTPSYNFTTATAGNKLLLAGGRRGPGDTPVSDVDIYDFGTQTWSTAHLSTARADMTAVTVGNKIFFAAGEAPGISSYNPGGYL